MIERWQKLASEVLGEYRVFKLRQDRSRSPLTGREHTFFVLESGDWVNVIPVTPEGKVVLIRQYRHGTEELTLEVPGGMVDKTDESPAQAAERELVEETGYAAEAIIGIGRVAPNPAILNNYCHSFVAVNARPVAPTHFDGAEDIGIELVGVEEIPNLIVSGQISHALVIAAFYFYEQWKKGNYFENGNS